MENELDKCLKEQREKGTVFTSEETLERLRKYYELINEANWKEANKK